MERQERENPTAAAPDTDLTRAVIRPGCAVREADGVTEIEIDKKHTHVNIDFKEAAQNVRSKESIKLGWTEAPGFVVWENDQLRIAFDSFKMGTLPVNPKLPPYSVSLVVKPGVEVCIHDEDSGYSTLTDRSGHIISKGVNKFHFYDSLNDRHQGGKPYFSLTVELDHTNKWKYPDRPPVSEESRELKKSWNRFWVVPNEDVNNYGFILEATPRKPLEFKTADDMRKLVGPAELIKIWERDAECDLEDISSCDYIFAYDPKSKSYALGEYTSGEGDHRLYIFNAKGRYVGSYNVGDDGTRGWSEAYSGELGKK